MSPEFQLNESNRSDHESNRSDHQLLAYLAMTKHLCMLLRWSVLLWLLGTYFPIKLYVSLTSHPLSSDPSPVVSASSWYSPALVAVTTIFRQRMKDMGIRHPGCRCCCLSFKSIDMKEFEEVMRFAIVTIHFCRIKGPGEHKRRSMIIKCEGEV